MTESLLRIQAKRMHADPECTKCYVLEKRLLTFMANLVTAAPDYSPIPSHQLTTFLQYGQGITKSECKESFAPLCVFLHNCLAKRGDIVPAFLKKQEVLNDLLMELNEDDDEDLNEWLCRLMVILS